MKNLLLITLLLSFNAQAEWYRLDWVNPVERADNSPYDHTVEGDSTNIYNANTGDLHIKLLPDVITYQENFPPGVTKMALTAKDNELRESAYSPLVEWCAKSAPKSFTNVVVERIPAPSPVDCKNYYWPDKFKIQECKQTLRGY